MTHHLPPPVAGDHAHTACVQVVDVEDACFLPDCSLRACRGVYHVLAPGLVHVREADCHLVGMTHYAYADDDRPEFLGPGEMEGLPDRWARGIVRSALNVMSREAA